MGGSNLSPIKAAIKAAGKRFRTRVQRPHAVVEFPATPLARGDRSHGDPTDDDLRSQWHEYGAKHDIQTGLLNQHWFQQALENMVRESDPAEGLALLWVDVLNLRREFTLWGWSGADALLSHVAGVLRSFAEPDVVIGRVSRSFVICVRGSKSDPGVRRRMQALVDEIVRPVAEFAFNPDVAAGLAFYPGDAESAEDLARYASLAADIAGQKGARAVLPFQPGMNSRMVRDHQMHREIERALETDQMRMVYQPKVDLATGRTLGAEALIRWTHPEWGEVPPAEFVPIAERSDLIHRLFELSLRMALRDTCRWIELGIAPPVISVNLSPANLRLEDVARRVRDLLAEFPIHPVQLELEVTESLLLDDEKLFTARIRQLKAIGVGVAIDDFGTRYTGFELLKDLPIDSMKIDRCFIRGIHRSPDLRALCNTIVAMGRHMKMRTVAEGIEEPEELEVLQQIGCDAGQGFLLQRPVDADEFTEFLKRWPECSEEFGFAQPEETAEFGALYGTS